MYLLLAWSQKTHDPLRTVNEFESSDSYSWASQPLDWSVTKQDFWCLSLANSQFRQMLGVQITPAVRLPSVPVDINDRSVRSHYRCCTISRGVRRGLVVITLIIEELFLQVSCIPEQGLIQ